MSAPPSDAVVLRPWSLFLNLSALSPPISFSDSTYRLSQNLRFFLANYVVLTLAAFLLTLLTRPLVLILFAGVFSAWFYLILWRDDQLSVLDYDIDRKVVLGILVAMTAVCVFWTGVWSRLLVAVAVGALIVVFHGGLRAPEDSMEDSPYGALLNVVDSPRGDYVSV